MLPLLVLFFSLARAVPDEYSLQDADIPDLDQYIDASWNCFKSPVLKNNCCAKIWPLWYAASKKTTRTGLLAPGYVRTDPNVLNSFFFACLDVRPARELPKGEVAMTGDWKWQCPVDTILYLYENKYISNPTGKEFSSIEPIGPYGKVFQQSARCAPIKFIKSVDVPLGQKACLVHYIWEPQYTTVITYTVRTDYPDALTVPSSLTLSKVDAKVATGQVMQQTQSGVSYLFGKDLNLKTYYIACAIDAGVVEDTVKVMTTLKFVIVENE